MVHTNNEILVSNKRTQQLGQTLQSIMLSKRSQFQKILCYMIPFVGHNGKNKTIGMECLISSDCWVKVRGQGRI